jgi:hypothetical protein
MDPLQNLPESATSATITLNEDPIVEQPQSQVKPGGLQFWMIIIALMTSTFLSTLDFVGDNLPLRRIPG